MSENREAAFLAKITASTTHELRNVLSIVKQTAGLMDDLIQASEGGRALIPDRLRQLAGSIGRQVERGSDLISNLHDMAHSLDPGPARTELSPAVERVAAFSERFARQRKQQVEVGSGDSDVIVAMNGLPLQMALFAAVEYSLGRLPEGGTVTLTPRGLAGRPYVDIVGGEVGEVPDIPAPQDAGWSRMEEELDRCGARVEGGEGAFQLRVVLPPSAS